MIPVADKELHVYIAAVFSLACYRISQLCELVPSISDGNTSYGVRTNNFSVVIIVDLLIMWSR